jgi:2-polyprenyl-3-methyl-5-hydroxy-6-metoxy-1,4-benzoquinol methylase
MDLKQKIEHSWETNAEAWTSAVRTGAIPSRVAGTDEAVLDAVGDLRPCRVLDVGCGEGWLARELARRGCDVTGFDGSSKLIARAQESSSAHFLLLSYADFIEDPDRIQGVFDRVVCNYSLFEEDLEPLLRLLYTKVACNGLLVVQTLHPIHALASGNPYQSGWRTETFESMGEKFHSSMPYFLRTFAGWCEQLRASGFTVSRCIEPGPSPSGKPLSLILVAEKSSSNE